MENLNQYFTKDIAETMVNGNGYLPSYEKKAKLDKLKVAYSLMELEQSRNEDWHEGVIFRWIKEFENIGFDTYTAIERINNAKYVKEWGTVTKFEHFIDESELVIDTELINLKAKLLLERGDYYDVRKYKILTQYYNSNKDMENTKEETNKIEYEIKIRIKMKSILDDAYKVFLESIYATGFLENPICEKATGDFITTLENEIDNFKL